MFSGVLRTSIIALLMLFSAAAAEAAETWLRAETANFEVVGNAQEAEVRSVADRLERFREAISKMMTVRQGSVKTRVVVFKDAASFRPFKPKRTDGSADDLASGFFQSGEDVNYIAISAGGGDLSTIYHEYAHDVIDASFGRMEIPAWLNEGLAEYFQTFRIVDDRTALLGGAPRSHINLLKQGPLISWDEFFALDTISLRDRGAHSRTLFYAQAWAVVQFLLWEAEKGGVAHLLHNKSSRNSVEPWMLQRLAEEIGRARIDIGTKAIIANTDFQPRTLEHDGAPPLNRTAISQVPEARANAHLGDLLYHLNEYQTAETYLQKALAADPKLPSANATLGMVKLRQRKFAEAKNLLETAMAGEADNHLVHFYYAYLLTREKMDEAGMVSSFSAASAAKIRDSLRRSIQLNDQFAESYRLLGFTALVTNEGLDEALAGLRKATQLRPGDTDIALMIPQLLLRQENAEDAWLAADRLARSTTDARTRTQAEDLKSAADQLSKSQAASGRITIYAGRQPVIYQWKDLTAAQVAQIEEDRVVNNINYMIERPRAGERLVVGYLGKIVCDEDRINYKFKTDDGELRLTGRRFDDLRLKVLIEGTSSFSFRCDAKVSDELIAIVYAPSANASTGNDGELRAISFVPKNFKLRTMEDLAKSPVVIIQGGPASSLEGNEKAAAAERAEMDRVMRETQLRDLEVRLRAPGQGEQRILATPEKLECTAGRMVLTTRNKVGVQLFSAPIADKFQAASFNSDAGILEIGCRATLPSLPAVVTYRQNGNDRELIAVEFVPTFYKLPSE